MNDAVIPHVWTQEDRDFFAAHFQAIAERLVKMRVIPRTARGTRFTADAAGCRYKFYVQAYPKHGSPIWHEQERERAELMAEFEAEYGKL